MSTTPYCASATKMQKTIGKIPPGQNPGTTVGGKAVQKNTVKPADRETDNSSSQGVSITDHGEDSHGSGSEGETSIQKFRRQAGKVVDNDWASHDDANGQPLQPLAARGFDNPRNMCYRNSLLQCLFHVPAFAQWMRFHHVIDVCDVDDCVACEVVRLINLYWSKDSKTLEPFKQPLKRLHKKLNKNGWRGITSQEDAHELYIFIAGAILDQVNQQFALITHTLTILMRKTVFYECCSEVTYTSQEEFNIYVGPAIGERAPQKLRSMIRQGMKDRVAMSCSVCGEISNRKCRTNIAAAPAVLVIHINRFHRDPSSQRYSKGHAIVRFGPRLDLSRYYLPNKPVRPQSLRYQLVGVISHAGTLNGGHYIATVRQPDKDPTATPNQNNKRRRSSDSTDTPDDGKWKLANDDRITNSSLADVQQEVSRQGVFTPYMLFYKRY